MEAHLRSRRQLRQRAQLSVQRCTTAGRSRSSTPHFRRLPGHPCTISTICCGRSNSYTLPLGRPASTSSSCSSFTFSSTPSFRISTSTGRYTTPSPFRHHQSPHHLPFRVHLVFIPRNPIYVLMISSRRILLSPFLWCPSLARSNTTHATTPPEFLQLQLLPALPDGHRLAQGSHERHSFILPSSSSTPLLSPHYALKDKPSRGTPLFSTARAVGLLEAGPLVQPVAAVVAADLPQPHHHRRHRVQFCVPLLPALPQAPLQELPLPRLPVRSSPPPVRVVCCMCVVCV